MMWAVLLHDAFDAELNDLAEAVQDEKERRKRDG